HHLGTVAPSVRRPQVLVVEDDLDIRDSFRDALLEAGLGVTTADDGQVALDLLLRQSTPDLIVLDLKMPNRSGWDLLETLRNSTSFVRIPVVVVSAYLGSPPA